MIERAVYNQIVYYLESHGLLDRRQHGFRKDHSTSTAIFELLQYVYEGIDNRKFVGCIYVDYSKAFDTLDHVILCKKLERYGMCGNVVEWCRSYLQFRKQRVKVNDQISDEADITYGVPQGSILGPLFFLIYVNDVITSFGKDDPRIILYADDTVIYCSDICLKSLQSKLTQGLEKLSNWCNLNKLTINFSKTKYEIFRPKNYNNITFPDFRISIGETVLDEVTNYNYLGVHIDAKLRFNIFLKEKCNKINLRLRQLGNLRKYITCDVANVIYKQTIIPLFDYADFLIESGPNMYIDRLNSLHSKAMQIIDCNKHRNATNIELERLYCLLTPKTRRREHHCAIMYRQSRISKILDVYRPSINLKGIDKSSLSRGITLWNKIPSMLQRATTKVKFKNGIRKILLDDL